MLIEEFDLLMELDPSGVVTHGDAAAVEERLTEWLLTPEGDHIDLPSWGNRLFGLKHEPPSESLNVLAEMALLEKLPRDVKDVNIRAVAVEFTEIDLCVVLIDYGQGIYQGEVRL